MRRLKKLASLGFILSAFMFAAANQAQAQNTTAPLEVKLQIEQGCSLFFGNGSAGLIDLGKKINLQEDIFGDTTLNVQCSKGSNVKYTVMLNVGRHADGDYKHRNLESEGNRRIAYLLCKNKACSDIWGDTESTGLTRTYPKDADKDTFSVYAKVPRQDGAVYPGTYTDTVIATVTYK